jgi:hypothetical protein
MYENYGVTEWFDANRYNKVAKPFKWCDMGDFWTYFMTYGIPKTEYYQVYFTPEDREKRHLHCVHIIIYHDAIFMIEVDRHRTENGRYEDKPTCYRIGCEHDYESIYHTLRGDNKDRCRKCGHIWCYDSGD